jgi:hypothetical protein
MNTVWLDSFEDITWVQDVHNVPADMRCVILYGNEDSPDRIEAWREIAPHYQAPPDFVYDRSLA